MENDDRAVDFRLLDPGASEHIRESHHLRLGHVGVREDEREILAGKNRSERVDHRRGHVFERFHGHREAHLPEDCAEESRSCLRPSVKVIPQEHRSGIGEAEVGPPTHRGGGVDRLGWMLLSFCRDDPRTAASAMGERQGDRTPSLKIGEHRGRSCANVDRDPADGAGRVLNLINCVLQKVRRHLRPECNRNLTLLYLPSRQNLDQTASPRPSPAGRPRRGGLTTLIHIHHFNGSATAVSSTCATGRPLSG